MYQDGDSGGGGSARCVLFQVNILTVVYFSQEQMLCNLFTCQFFSELPMMDGPLLFITCSWFDSFLNGRAQQVKIGRTLSSKSLLCSGVPQGGILSPIIFVIYGADMEQWLNYVLTCITSFQYPLVAMHSLLVTILLLFCNRK